MAKKSSKNLQEKNSPTIENRRARYDYAITDTLECGMVLMGSEVKSIRSSKVSLQEGFVRVEAPGVSKPLKNRRMGLPGLYLYGVNISEYGPAGRTGSDGQHRTTRVRTLLVNKRELAKLAGQVSTKGYTLVPLKIYFKDGKAKLLIGLGKGKTFGDKRESIAKRETDRDMQRAMTRRRD
jgi:SsrA-binding protein